MCIRDRHRECTVDSRERKQEDARLKYHYLEPERRAPKPYSCLLYTSDAADERSSVDLGGRRIIKKKKYIEVYRRCNSYTT